jgi:hypothetical protein
MMKGKWAAGIPPRHLTWVLPGVLAVAERPGGQATTHRRVRRQEEVIWLRENDFDVVVSILTSPQNLAAYSELGVAASHQPIPRHGDLAEPLARLYAELGERVRSGQRVLLHHDELGDWVIGVTAGFFLWTGRLEDAPQATAVAEQLFGRQLGPEGRQVIATVAELAAKR